MFDERHYVPVLQARRAELVALRELPQPISAALTPLFEVPYTEWVDPEDLTEADLERRRSDNLSAR